jgi:hypothetical protein
MTSDQTTSTRKLGTEIACRQGYEVNPLQRRPFSMHLLACLWNSNNGSFFALVQLVSLYLRNKEVYAIIWCFFYIATHLVVTIVGICRSEKPRGLRHLLSSLAWTLAGHSGRAVWGMNCLRSLGRWDRGFESHLRHGCLVCVCVYSVLVLSYV